MEDLDDLMGGTPKKNQFINNMDLEDDDDFFGGGGFGGRKAEGKSKKSKQDSNDPLAFLQRAKEEK